MDDRQREMILRYQPYIFRDRKDPFPIRFVGCTIFTEKVRSESFPKWVVDPAAVGAEAIIEYAIYYDYDNQAGTNAYQHIGAQSCWTVFCPSFQSDQASNRNSCKNTDDYR
jgi:hypothetical protein